MNYEEIERKLKNIETHLDKIQRQIELLVEDNKEARRVLEDVYKFRVKTYGKTR